MDELKSDAAKVETEAKTLEARAKQDVLDAEGWVKTHWVWIAGALGLVVGFIVGHLL